MVIVSVPLRGGVWGIEAGLWLLLSSGIMSRKPITAHCPFYMKTRDFKSDIEVFALVSAFESGSLALVEFNHAAHVAVALAYLSRSPLTEATRRMREALLRFLAHHGETKAYHETLTVFWMRLLAHLVSERHAAQPLCERINAVVRSHGGSWPVAAHYSHELRSSAEARQRWVAPDLIPLSF